MDRETEAATPTASTGTLCLMTLGTGILVVVQTAVGMVVNLYVNVPKHHPGAHPADYFVGSFRSVIWAVAHGAGSLEVHAALGVALVVMATGVGVRAVRLHAGWVSFTSVLGAMLVIGAGFNGASFLDFGGQNLSWLIMALLALGALSCYMLGLFMLKR